MGAPYIYDISSLRVNTSAGCSGRKQVKGKVMVNKYVCIPRSFLVINVCNQGKTLCSPCIIHMCLCPVSMGFLW